MPEIHIPNSVRLFPFCACIVRTKRVHSLSVNEHDAKETIMNTQTSKPKIQILAPHIYKLRSTSGMFYAIRNGKCGGGGVHRASMDCKHARFVKAFESAIAEAHLQAARREVERRERQRINSKMYEWFNG